VFITSRSQLFVGDLVDVGARVRRRYSALEAAISAPATDLKSALIPRRFELIGVDEDRARPGERAPSTDIAQQLEVSRFVGHDLVTGTTSSRRSQS